MILLSFACGLALIYGVWFSLAGPSWTKSVIKTGTVLILAALAFIGGGPFALVLGFLFGAMGDFWLSRDGERPFLLGLVSFAIGHIAYIVLLWQFGAVAAVSIWTVLLAGFSAAMALYLWQPAGALRGPVLVYIVIIATLGFLALGLPEAARLGGWRRLSLWCQMRCCRWRFLSSAMARRSAKSRRGSSGGHILRRSCCFCWALAANCRSDPFLWFVSRLGGMQQRFQRRSHVIF